VYSDTAAVAAVPAGVTGAALFAPTQAAIGLAMVAALVAMLAIALSVRASRLAEK
jgi:hypothetical protein